MTFPILPSNSPATGYNLQRSLRFRASASAYLNRTFGAGGNRNTWTWSGWRKRGQLGSVQNLLASFPNISAYSFIQFTSSDTLRYASTTTGGNLITTQVFRDPSAYYHIVVAYDDTQATASNRVKIYVNGNQVTAFGTSTYPDQNFGGYINGAFNHFIGQDGNSAGYFDGYATEDVFVGGQALTPSSFGSYNSVTGVWQPAAYTGTYGTNGFYLPFTDNSALTTSSNVGLGKDFSGNGNYWTTNNISLTAGVTYDSMTDVPTLTSATVANYAVLNPVGNGGGTLSNANLRSTISTTLSDVSGFAMSSGKWYWEVTITTTSNPRIGVYDVGSALPSAGGLGGTAYGWCLLNGPSRVFYNGTATNYGSFNGNAGDVVMLAYDPSNGNLWYGANGSWFASGNPATGANPSQTGVTGKAIVAATASGSGSNVFDYNFGQQPWAFTPPSGFVALNTYNLPDSTIPAGNKYMDATLYTGNGSTQTITNSAGFQPDLVWYKGRNVAYNNSLYDSVRGATKQLISNTTDAEATLSGVTAFNSNGFSLGSASNGNNSADTYVGWQWQAGQGSSSSNTNGTITSTVSVNASAGFSVVTYTGTAFAGTIGHGLGVAPSMIIVKPRSAAVTTDAWNVYHVSTGNTNFLVLNATDASAAASNRWNNTSPTSSVFSIGNIPSSVAVGYVAYCWSEIAGFSKFGSYTGNGSADGTFVYLGFKPKFILIKRTDTAGNNWRIWDTSRAPYNLGVNSLFPNTPDVEDSVSDAYDLLSNGFKIRSSGGGTNASGGTYVYACWAENPFKNSLAR